MAMTAALPDAVQWFEGMMMSSHHFQQNDVYWHEHLRHRLRAANPHCWGLVHLRYSLIQEVLTITELECLLPDGLVVQFAATAPYRSATLGFDAAGKCTSGGAPLRLWLSVRARGDKAAVAQAAERRYNSVVGGAVSDENTGMDELAFARLQVQCELHLGTQCPPNAVACPLLELRRDGDGLAVTDYHPPMLQIDASGFQVEHQSLAFRLARLNELLWTKVQQLAGDVHPRGHGQDSEDGPRGAERRSQLDAARRISACLPALAASLEGSAHPARLYQVISHVIGQVAGIGPNPLPLYMHPYQHDHCMPQFQAAFDFIAARLALVDTSHDSMPFSQLAPDQHGVSRFERHLPADAGNVLIVELRSNGTQTSADMCSWMDEAVIMGTGLGKRLESARIQGAYVRPLKPHELRQYSVGGHAVLRAIDNRAIGLDGRTVPAFVAGQPLTIAGVRNARMPDAITLYRARRAAGQAADSADTSSHAAGRAADHAVVE
jgi:type VI secretion system protein ImpJ